MILWLTTYVIAVFAGFGIFFILPEGFSAATNFTLALVTTSWTTLILTQAFSEAYIRD